MMRTPIRYAGMVLFALTLTACNGGTANQGTGSSGDAGAAAVEERSQEQVTIKQSPDKYTWYVKNYVGMNAASVGYTALDGTRRDAYGGGTLKIVFLTEDGCYLDYNDEEQGDAALRDWKVVAQNLEPNTELSYTFMSDDEGEEYDSLVNCQNYEEIVLAVAPVDEAAPTVPELTTTEPAPDKHTRYVKDYVGRNLATCGYYSLGGTYNDHYGQGYVIFDIVTDDGSYVDAEDVSSLAQYRVTAQSIKPNTPVTMTFTTDENGEEYDNLVSSQSITHISLNVTHVDA